MLITITTTITIATKILMIILIYIFARGKFDIENYKEKWKYTNNMKNKYQLL